MTFLCDDQKKFEKKENEGEKKINNNEIKTERDSEIEENL